MGIFTRFRDIINANINDMMDQAEEPEVLIKLIIREMEDTLVELKASCAAVVSDHKRIQRQAEKTENEVKEWANKAALAVKNDRDNQAREALRSKYFIVEQGSRLQKKMGRQTAVVEQYRDDIRQLQDKLNSAREKQRLLVQRQSRTMTAGSTPEAPDDMAEIERRVIMEALEKRLTTLETEVGLAESTHRSNLKSEFDALIMNEDLEAELRTLKSKLNKK